MSEDGLTWSSIHKGGSYPSQPVDPKPIAHLGQTAVRTAGEERAAPQRISAGKGPLFLSHSPIYKN